jgi:hypothetical protein
MADAPQVASSPVDAQKQQLDQMVKSLLSRAMAPKMGMPTPQPRYGEKEFEQGAMNMETSRSKGNKADMGVALQNFGTTINNLVAQHKQNQTRDALADWQGFDQAIQKAQLVAGDPSAPDYQKKVQEALGNMPWVKAMLDPANQKNVKRLKNMYKALNVDLLDDKENVYGQALKQLHKVKAAEGKMTDAKDKMEMARKRQQTMQSRLANLMSQAKATPPDPQQEERAMALGLEHEKNQIEAAKAGIDKWEFKQGAGEDGKPQWFAFDKTHPDHPAKTLEIDGKQIMGAEKPNFKAGSTLQIEGKPYGVYGSSGKLLTPKDPEFAKDEMAQRHWEAANESYAIAEAQKQKLAGIRAQTYINSREYGVIASEDIPELGIKAGDMREMNANIINKFAGKFAPVGGAAAAMQKEAVFTDINRQADNFEEAAANLKHGISPWLRGQMILAARSSDPEHAFGALMSPEMMNKLPEDVQNYLLAHAVLVENAMAIRGIAGMGQGAQDLREAITRALPGSTPANSRVVKEQMRLFRGMVDRLHTGVPGVMTPKKPLGKDEIPD